MPGNWRVPVLVAITATVIAMAVQSSTIARNLQHDVSDAIAAALQRVVDSDTVVVAIDSESLAELRQWPWPRSQHARLLDELREAGARKVFYDIDFSAESNALDDAVLADALRKWTSSPVILPAFWQPSIDGSTYLLTQPLELFRRHVNLASVNLNPGSDGLVRTVRSSWTIGGVGLPAVFEDDITESRDAGREFSIDYSISPSSFDLISFADIAAGRVAGERVAGKVVYVGATALELGDVLPVPVHHSLPGVIVQALAAETVVTGIPASLSKYIVVPAIFLWSFCLSIMLARFSWKIGGVAVAVGLGSVLAASMYLYYEYRTVLEVVPFFAAGGCSFLLSLLIALDDKTLKLLAVRLGLRRSEEIIRSIVESSADCIVQVDGRGTIQASNSAAELLFEQSAEQMAGTRINALIPGLFNSVGDDVSQLFNHLAGGLHECHLVLAGGKTVPVELSFGRVDAVDDSLYIMILRDLTWRIAKERDLHYQATHDPLTDLPNRTALADKLGKLIDGDNARDAYFALLMIDLNRFKEVNDTLGHSVGDDVLRDVSNRLSKAVGKHGFIARVGGDEFAVVLDAPGDSLSPAAVAEKLQASLDTPLDAGGISVELGMSIGIACFPEDADDAESLFKNADIAMYVSKERGSACEFYEVEHDNNSVRKLGMIGQLRSAIDQDNIELYYQPKIELATNRVNGAEALLRWEHPSLGAVDPEEFIVLVEASDLIQVLTEWTLKQAFREVRHWHDQGISGPVAINLSARLLRDNGFPQRLERLLSDARIEPADLELEITESAIMVDPAQAVEVINRIRALGTKVSIDDYGTGYSSLAYLRDLKLNSIKIDKSYVINMENSDNDRVIVESTIQMAHGLGLQVVAEGVESEWAHEHLRHCGCDFAQGYYYSKAVPSSDFVEWARDFENNPPAAESANDDLLDDVSIRANRS
ncbi:MAG: EAL domain-containing protein [Gammaproteobacteria bacterium]|nr:EAL domain-containing protein [Gammaproteobacteria bacterium]